VDLQDVMKLNALKQIEPMQQKLYQKQVWQEQEQNKKFFFFFLN